MEPYTDAKTLQSVIGHADISQFAIIVQMIAIICALWLTATSPAFIVHWTRRDMSPPR